MEFCFTKFLQLVRVINFPSFFFVVIVVNVCLFIFCLFVCFFLTTYKISSVGKKSLVITYFRAHE